MSKSQTRYKYQKGVKIEVLAGKSQNSKFLKAKNCAPSSRPLT